MSTPGEVLVGVVILLGLTGILLPVLPGLLLVVAAILVWAIVEGSTLGWVVFALSVGLAAAATIVKYLVPGRRLRESGVPTSTIFLAGIGAIVGFFAIPVAGAPIGFIVAIYVIQWNRLGRAQAWPATLRTAGAVALSVGIELGFGLAIAGVWLLAALFG